MEKVKISIVTPSYNQGKYIERAIHSVMNQNYENIEHIIVDGGSTDNTVEILKKYPKLKWISEKDKGQSDALNKGFKMATGDVIGWLNCDDYYEKNIFQTVIDNLDKESIDAVYGQNYFIDINGNVTGIKYPNEPSKFVSCFYCYIPTTSFFFKKRLLGEHDFVDKKFHITMDKELFARLESENCRMLYVREPWAYFMWHGDNKSALNDRVRKICQSESIEIMNRYFYDFSKYPYWLQKLLQKALYNLSLVRRKMLK